MFPLGAPAWLKDQGKASGAAVNVPKLYSIEAAVRAKRVVTHEFGGPALIQERPVAPSSDDAKVLGIGEGKTEIRRIALERSLGLRVG